ncbi:MAG: class II aldolase/adducin family protein, partial [Thermoprotei archaeon]
MEDTQKGLVARCMRMLYERKLVTATGGNVSAKRDEDSFYITPTSLLKGDITENDVSLVTVKGEMIEGRYKPSSEWRMHGAIYQSFPDVNFIVHAHPTYALALIRSG